MNTYAWAVKVNNKFCAEGLQLVWTKKRAAAERVKFYGYGDVVRVKVTVVGRKKRK